MTNFRTTILFLFLFFHTGAFASSEKLSSRERESCNLGKKKQKISNHLLQQRFFLKEDLQKFCSVENRYNSYFSPEDCLITARVILDSFEFCFPGSKEKDRCFKKVDSFFSQYEKDSFQMVLWNGRSAKILALKTFKLSFQFFMEELFSPFFNVLETTKMGLLLDYVTNHSKNVERVTTAHYWEALSFSFSGRAEDRTLATISAPRLDGYFWSAELVNIIRQAKQDSEVVIEWVTEFCERDLVSNLHLTKGQRGAALKNCPKACEEFVFNDFNCSDHAGLIGEAFENESLPQTAIYCKTYETGRSLLESDFSTRLNIKGMKPVKVCSRR